MTVTCKSLRNPSWGVADKVCGALVGLSLAMMVAAGLAATVLAPEAAPLEERILVRAAAGGCVLVLTSEAAGRGPCQE
jgi:hypothetical protein